jgi:hypothetical protein
MASNSLEIAKANQPAEIPELHLDLRRSNYVILRYTRYPRSGPGFEKEGHSVRESGENLRAPQKFREILNGELEPESFPERILSAIGSLYGRRSDVDVSSWAGATDYPTEKLGLPYIDAEKRSKGLRKADGVILLDYLGDVLAGVDDHFEGASRFYSWIGGEELPEGLTSGTGLGKVARKTLAAARDALSDNGYLFVVERSDCDRDALPIKAAFHKARERDGFTAAEAYGKLMSESGFNVLGTSLIKTLMFRDLSVDVEWSSSIVLVGEPRQKFNNPNTAVERAYGP